MNDMLSQDQIDSLLSGTGLEGTSGLEDDGGQEPAADRYPALSKTFELFCTQGGNVISTVLNKKTSMTSELCEKANFASIREKINAVVVSLNLSLKSGFQGDFYLLIQKKDVAVLSDLMMMGDGTAEYSEDHKDAIGELFNQVMGAFTTAMGSEVGFSVGAGPVEVTEFDMDNPPFPPDSIDMVVARLDVEGLLESHIALLVPVDLGDQIIEKVKAGEGGEGAAESDKVGLNMSELDDLSKVAADFGAEGGMEQFEETNLSTGNVSAPRENVDMLLDIDLDVSIELGRAQLSIKRVLDLAPGSVVELDRMAGEPVDLLVNNKVVAKGEVVVIDENFGIRIVSLVSTEDRIKSLR